MRVRPQQYSIRRSLRHVRLGLREGFAVDLTTARANGTMWDLIFEDDRAELRQVQKRAQPEVLAGSPPSDDFSSLLSTRAEPREISKLKTERIEPQIRACVQSYKLQMEMQNTSFMNIPKIPVRGRCLRFNPSSMTRSKEIRIGEMHFAGPVPDEGDYPTELEGKWGVYGTWIDPKLLIAGRRKRKWSR